MAGCPHASVSVNKPVLFSTTDCAAIAGSRYALVMNDHVRRLTSTQVVRNFSHLLDLIEDGIEVVIKRHGRAVAVIGPAESAPRRIPECLSVKLPRASVSPDPDFARDLNDIVAGNPT